MTAVYAKIQTHLSATLRAVFLRVSAPFMRAMFMSTANDAENEIFLAAFENYMQSLIHVAMFVRDTDAFDLRVLAAYLDGKDTSDEAFAPLVASAVQTCAAMAQSFPRQNVDEAGKVMLLHCKQMLTLIHDCAYTYRTVRVGEDLERALLLSTTVRGATSISIDDETKAAMQTAMQALYSIALGINVLASDVYRLSEVKERWQELFGGLSEQALRSFYVECGKTASKLSDADLAQLGDAEALYGVVSSDLEKAQTSMLGNALGVSESELVTITALIKLGGAAEQFARALLTTETGSVDPGQYKRLVPQMHNLVKNFVRYCAIASTDRFSVAVQYFEALQALTHSNF
jgi:hypothetical protein